MTVRPDELDGRVVRAASRLEHQGRQVPLLRRVAVALIVDHLRRCDPVFVGSSSPARAVGAVLAGYAQSTYTS
eukprot:470153-Pyramimonas_sp.AAC.1